MAPVVKNHEISQHLIAPLRRHQFRDRRTDHLLGRIAKKIFSRPIPASDSAIGTGAVDRVTGVFDDGRHLAGTAIGSRFRQSALTSHASGKYGKGEEHQQPFEVRVGADGKAEEGRDGKKVQARG